MTKEFNLAGTHDKWLTLMNYIQHSAPMVYQLTFPDGETAERAAKNMYTTAERNPTWFEVKIIRRRNVVFVIKKDHIQEAVVINA